MSTLKDQYLKMHDLFDAEHSRLWIRFNLFTGIQMILIAGFASNYHELIKDIVLCIILLTAGFVFSIFTILVTMRSNQINMGMLQTIQELEEIDENLILLKIFNKYIDFNIGSITQYCIVMSTVFSLLWIALFIKILCT